MLLFTLVGLGKEVPPTIAGALQHFAAGVLLCTIVTELLPEMVSAEGVAQNVAAGVGFFLGVAVLILLGILIPEHDDDDKEENDHEEEKLQLTSLPLRQHSLMTVACQCREYCRFPRRSSSAVEAAVVKEESPLLSSTPENANKSFPLALILAIAIDSTLDGLLIGIACAAGPSAGPMMSASLTVEMSFLGLLNKLPEV